MKWRVRDRFNTRKKRAVIKEEEVKKEEEKKENDVTELERRLRRRFQRNAAGLNHWFE